MTLILKKPLTVKNPIYLSAGNLPAQIAGVAPTLDYRFARDRTETEAVSLTDKLTVTTVDADGTYVNQGGWIEQATSNNPRFDHDPSTRLSKGLLLESAATNSAFYSAGFSNSYWTKTSCTVSANEAVAPDGSNTAWLMRDAVDASSQVHIIQRGSVAISLNQNDSIVASAFFKAGTTNGAQLIFVSSSGFGSGVNPNATFDNGSVVTTASGGSGSIQSIGDGWYRAELSASLTAGAITGINVQFRMRYNSSTFYTGTGAGTMYWWGAQVEAGTTASTYIPTTSAAVTRSAESIKIAAGSGVITGTYTMVEKPAGCATVSGTDILLNTGYTAERVMVFPTSLTAGQITSIRAAM